MGLKLDTIENSRAEESEDGLRIVRGGTIDGLTTSGNGLYDPSVLPAALDYPGLPTIGEPHPAKPSAKVVRRIALPMQSHDTVRIEIHYEDTQLLSAIPDNKFRIIRDSCILTNEISEVDYNGEPLSTKFRNPAGSGDNRYERRVIKANRYVPLNTIVCSGTVIGKPSLNTKRCMARVNDSAFLDLPKGFWLCTSVDVGYPLRGNRYILTATFLSKLHWSWRFVGKYYDDRGLAPETITASDFNALVAADYTLTRDVSRNGLIGAALYGTADFGAIFEIIEPPS